MAATYEKIASTTLGSASATISFTSIAGTYTDLKLVLVSTSSGGNSIVRLNADSGANYSTTNLIGDQISASSANATSQTDLGLSQGNVYASNTPTPQLVIFDFFSYSGSTYKTVLIDQSQDLPDLSDGRVVKKVSLWRNTAAITSIVFSRDSSFTYSTGTTATLYGIKAA